MKNRILTALAICISVMAGAQDKNWKIAIHVDPNFSWMKPDSKFIAQDDGKLKFGFGVMVDKMFTNNYAFGTGFNIVNTGGQLSYFQKEKSPVNSSQNIITERTRTYNLKYVEVPLTLKLRTNEIGYVTYWAQIGFGLAINIKAKGSDNIVYKTEEFKDNPNTPDVEAHEWKESKLVASSSEDDDIKGDIGIFRTSLIIAGGIEYNLSGNASLLVGVTFDNGFNNVLTSEGVKKNGAGNPEYDTFLNPQLFDLKSISNFLALNVGVLF